MKYTIISCFLFGLFATAHGLIKAGDFQNYAHGIGGEVMIQDEKTIIIRGFTYDGAGKITLKYIQFCLKIIFN